MAIQRYFPFSVLSAAISAALVGFAGSVALILEAARTVGADEVQATSWVVALCLGIALTSLFLSWHQRMPIVTAWSTPGAAVIAATGAGVALAEAIGAFLLAALLVLATGLIGPFARLMERIPKALAAAMLAGILLRFCLEVVGAVALLPLLVLPLVLAFFAVQLWSASLTVPLVLGLGIALAASGGLIDPSCCAVTLSTVTVTSPRFDLAAALGLTLPLYVVTMASQNLAGLAVLKADGFSPSARTCLGATGIASLLAAPFGGHGVCLAAITASICTGPGCHPEPSRRWLSGIPYALAYLIFAAFAETLVELLLALPAALITTFVGLALFGPMVGSLKAALAGNATTTKAAVVTFLVAASDLTMVGIGAPLWSLAAGLLLLALPRLRRAGAAS
ncbi:MAG: benzoate/H(+) symporter BenE family transporter [Pseudomonadota bacterium]